MLLRNHPRSVISIAYHLKPTINIHASAWSGCGAITAASPWCRGMDKWQLWVAGVRNNSPLGACNAACIFDHILFEKMIKIQSQSRTITDVWGQCPGRCPFSLIEIVSLAMPFVVPLVAQKEFCNHKGLKIKQGPDLGFLKDLFKGLALFDVLAIFDHLQICWFSLGPPPYV